MLFAACAGGPKQVRGLVVDFGASSIAQLQFIELRTDQGRVYHFAVEGDVGITPGHTRDHMLQAEPVTVTYREERDLLVALKVDD